MNILLIINRFDFGGAENHVCDLANELSKRGHRVILIGGKGRQVKKLSSSVKFIPLKLRDFLLPLQVLFVAYLIVKNKINIIHAHQRLAIIVGALAGLLTNRKTVATVHGRARYDLRSKLSRKLTSKIIIVSQKVLEHANRRYNFGNKAVLIPNGIDIKTSKNDATPYRIYHISRIDKSHYNFLELMIKDVLPNLLKKYPKTEFHVVGDGKKKEDLISIAQKIKKTHGDNCCQVHGYESQISKIYQDASLIIGVGRVALEAAAQGVPVISANSKRMGGLLTIEKYENIKNTNFIDVKSTKPSSKELIKCISSFFSQQNKYKNEAQAIAHKVKTDFSIDSIVKKIESVYKNLQTN
ncbi:MAG: glycosyltransferase [Bacteroidales bacterium]